MRFKDKKIVVTGASSGIGAAIAQRLSFEGAELVVVARRENELLKLCDRIKNEGGRAHYIKSDLSLEEERSNLCKAINEIWPDKIDVLVNAAGMQSIRPLTKSSTDFWHTLMEINVITAADLTNKLAPKLSAGGSVVNISSVAGLTANPGAGVYAATKAALISFTKTAAVEFSARGIRVNVILPGMVKTAMLDDMLRFYTTEQREALEKRHLLGFGDPLDVAAAVCFIAGDEARWITGASLVIDGGFTLT
jgi:NAD(P)-dependent dehydrogenase (short-subunit alcohol dehydrogenase family)